MNQQIIFAPLSQTGLVEASSVAPARASPQATHRFEQLMFAPGGSTATNLHVPASSGENGMRMYVQHLSQRWEAGQTALKTMLAGGKFTSSELVLTQVQMINCALDVEVSSKCASIFENGVQTLVQRAGA